MKRLLLALILPVAALAADPVPAQQPDFQAAAVGYRQALASANDQLADALGKLARAQQQIAELQAKIAELQKQVPAAPAPAKK